MTAPSSMVPDTSELAPRTLPAATDKLPTLPPTIEMLAEELGVRSHLPAVLDMTRRIFPQGELAVSLVEPHSEAAEDEEDGLIVFEVDVTGWNVEQRVEAQQRWSREIAAHCPLSLTHHFAYHPRERP
jgi:hypothetical protein